MRELNATKGDINSRSICSIQWRDQIDCALASLRNDACYPVDSEAKLLKNVTDWFGGLILGTTATICVFPECGSGYFEWSAFVRMRRETNVLDNVQRIVMMDSRMNDDFIPCSCIVVVVYINGSFRFSPFTLHSRAVMRGPDCDSPKCPIGLLLSFFTTKKVLLL